MPTPTYDLIASNVLSSNATSITFSAIPNTYRDLVLVITAKQTAGTGQNQLRFNGYSSSIYGNVSLEGTGSSVQSAGGLGSSFFYINLNNGDLDAQFMTAIVEIFDYAQTNKHKPLLSRGNNLGSGTSVGANAHRWTNTEAVDTILCQASGTYASGSSFHLYGIAG